jgi:alpha-galactosidase/6-phospho-beta-glucosidase family protein
VAGLNPEKLDAVSIGLNHGSWSVRHLYEGQDFIPILHYYTLVFTLYKAEAIYDEMAAAHEQYLPERLLR